MGRLDPDGRRAASRAWRSTCSSGRSQRPRRVEAPGGFQRLRLGAGDTASGPIADPDGTGVELVRARRPAPRPRRGVRRPGRVRTFYVEVVGLDQVDASRFCDDRGPEAFTVELVGGPPPGAAACRQRRRRSTGSPSSPRTSTATTTPCTTRACRRTRRPPTLDMGPGLPSLRALFFPDPDGSTLELIERPQRIEGLGQTRSPPARCGS